MTYYAFIQNNEINGVGQCRQLTDGVQNVEITEDVYNSIDHYMWDGENVVINPNYDEEQAAKEQERINNLTMTPLDFINVLQSFGLTLEEINTFLESNLTIKMQLTYCNLVYCGVVKQFLPITIDGITITNEMVEYAFKLKNGEEE